MQDVWDVPANGSLTGENAYGSLGGHAVITVGYDAEHVFLATWGMVQKCTWRFLAAYMDESYAVFSPDEWLGVAGVSPSNFNLAQLTADHAALA